MESFICSEGNTRRHFYVDSHNILDLLPFMGHMQIHFFIFTHSSYRKSSQRCRTSQANDLKIFLRNHREYLFVDKEGSQLVCFYLHISPNNFIIYNRNQYLLLLCSMWKHRFPLKSSQPQHSNVGGRIFLKNYICICRDL